jgi:hypothetical protein
MKHAVIHFVDIGHVGATAPTLLSAAMPLPPGALRVRR